MQDFEFGTNNVHKISGKILMQVSRFKPENLVFWFEKFFGQSSLAVLSEVRGAEASSFGVCDGLAEGVRFQFGQ